MKKIVFLVSTLTLGAILYAGDNFYLGEGFNKRHSAVKESFVKSVAKNRAYSHMGDASYTKIRNKEEFKDALKSGKLSKKIDGNKVTNSYNVIDIENVRINKNDIDTNSLEDDDRLLIGSKVEEGREKLMQTINIKNSKIETDKKLNVGVLSSSEDLDDITNRVEIERSSLKGKAKKATDNMSRLELFEQLEKANEQ
jgi:hypothetical protein